MISCIVCTTQGVPICSVNRKDGESNESISRLIASVSCLLTQTRIFTMRTNNTSHAIVTKYIKMMQYHVVFSTESDHLNVFNELLTRAAIVSHALFSLHKTVVACILAHYDAKSSHDLANATFANSVGDSRCLDEEVLEEVFGADIESKEALANFEDHVIHDLVHTPLSESVSDPWFRSLETVLRKRDSATVRCAAAFVFAIESSSRHENATDSIGTCTLSPLVSRDLATTTSIDQESHHRPLTDPLDDSWLALIRLHVARFVEGEEGEGEEESARLMSFARSAAPSHALQSQFIVVAKIAVSHVLVVRLPLSLADTDQLAVTATHCPLSSQECHLSVCPLQSQLPQDVLEAWARCCEAMRGTLVGGAVAVDPSSRVPSLSVVSASPESIAVTEHSHGSQVAFVDGSELDATVSPSQTIVEIVPSEIDSTEIVSQPAVIRPVPPPANKSSASRAVIKVGSLPESTDSRPSGQQKQQSTRPGRTLRPV